MIPQLLFARFVGALTECCSAAIVVEIDLTTNTATYFCGGCLRTAPFVPFPAVRMGLTEEWPWKSRHPLAALAGSNPGIVGEQLPEEFVNVMRRR